MGQIVLGALAALGLVTIAVLHIAGVVELRPADWIAISAAVVSLASSGGATWQANSAKAQADAAVRQADAAETSAKSATDKAELAKTQAEAAAQQARIAIDILSFDFVAVLMKGENGEGYKFIELQWKGPEVLLESVVATKWVAIGPEYRPVEAAIMARDTALEPVNRDLPGIFRKGDKKLFHWPGPSPRPNFAGKVRCDYRFEGKNGSLEREIDIPGYSGFRYVT